MDTAPLYLFVPVIPVSMDEKMQGLDALLAEMEVGKVTAVDVC